MIAEKVNIPVLLGTSRQGRYSEHMAKLVHARLQERDDVITQLLDVRDMHFPEGDYVSIDQNLDYKEAVVAADGIAIISPEYNHGYPGVLKMALDMLYKEYIYKAVGICAVSSGSFGGVRMVEHLTPVLRTVGLIVSPAEVNVPNVGTVFDEDGTLKDKTLVGRVEAFIDELVWLSTSLKWGRENLANTFRAN